MIRALLAVLVQASLSPDSSISRAVFPDPPPVFRRTAGTRVRAALEVLSRLRISPDQQIVVVAASEPPSSNFDPDRGFAVRLAGLRRVNSDWVLVWVRDISPEIPVRINDDVTGAVLCAEVWAKLKSLPGSSLFLMALGSRLSGSGRVQRTDLTARTIDGHAPGLDVLRVPSLSEFGRAGYSTSYSKGGEVRWIAAASGSPATLDITYTEQRRVSSEVRPPHRTRQVFQWTDGNFVARDPGEGSRKNAVLPKPVLSMDTGTEPTATPRLDLECEALRDFASGLSAITSSGSAPLAELERRAQRLRARPTEPPCGHLETRELQRILLDARKSVETDPKKRAQVASELRRINHEISSLEGIPASEIHAADRAANHAHAERILKGLIRRFPWDPGAAHSLCQGNLGQVAVPNPPPPKLLAAMLAGCRTAVTRLQPFSSLVYPEIEFAIAGRFRELGCHPAQPEPPSWSATPEDTKEWLGSFECPVLDPMSPTKRP